MEGLIPQAHRALKNLRIRRRYERLSSSGRRSQSFRLPESYLNGQSPVFMVSSPVKQLSLFEAEKMAGHHRRSRSFGDLPSSVVRYGRGGRGSGALVPVKKFLLRFSSHRWFSCVTGSN